MPILGVVGEIALITAVGVVAGFVASTFTGKPLNNEVSEDRTSATSEIYYY